MIEVLAYHGWGFDSNFWKNWETIIPPSIRWMNADRGYFGEEKVPEFSDNGNIKW